MIENTKQPSQVRQDALAELNRYDWPHSRLLRHGLHCHRK